MDEYRKNADPDLDVRDELVRQSRDWNRWRRHAATVFLLLAGSNVAGFMFLNYALMAERNDIGTLREQVGMMAIVRDDTAAEHERERARWEDRQDRLLCERACQAEQGEWVADDCESGDGGRRTCDCWCRQPLVAGFPGLRTITITERR